MTPPPPFTSALATLQNARSENDVTLGITRLVEVIFPQLGCRTEVPVGKGRMDLVVGGVTFEAKRPGNIDELKNREQLGDYLEELSKHPRLDLGDNGSHKWKGIISDGRDWFFYDHRPRKSLRLRRQLNSHHDPDGLHYELRQTIDPSLLAAPPTDRPDWAESLLKPFTSLAQQSHNLPRFEIKQRLWADVLAGAHIIPPDDPKAALDLFVRHTLLVVLARLVAETIAPSGRSASDGFAAWIVESQDNNLIEKLRQEINKYNWRTGRDILKDFYHSAIHREIRHDFGEYYTPDWLASAVVEEVCDPAWVKQTLAKAIEQKYLGPQVLDPACGSGTFIYAAVKHLDSYTQEVDDPSGIFQNTNTKAKILNRLVAGLDLHPVAVELARATKLLALGCNPDGPLNIWLGDSLQWATKPVQTLDDPGIISIPTSDAQSIRLPVRLVLSDRYEQDLNMVFDTASEIGDNHDQTIAQTITTNSDDESAILETTETLRGYISSDRNGVWQWFLANIVQPFRLSKNKPTRLLGNPPWVVFRNMSPERQTEFREHAQNRNIWEGGKLATQNDLAALFAATTVDLYLEDDCKFGFVLPYAALEARHWKSFRSGKWDHKPAHKPVRANLCKTWNLIEVKEPPFPQAPSSVVFGTKAPKNRGLTSWLNATGKGITLKSSWAEVSKKLSFNPNKTWRVKPGDYSSKKFRQGATLVPQSLVIAKEILPLPGKLVSFETKDGKAPWRGKELGGRQGTVETNYVHKTILSKHLIPFGNSDGYYLIAPIEGDQFIDPKKIKNASNMSRYWTKASVAYGKGRKLRAPNTLEKQIDYMNKLSVQLATRGKKSHKVIYNMSGSNLCAAVINPSLIVGHTLYHYSTNTAEEAHYLAAIFNAACLNQFFKEACRAADRHFNLAPVENLPIPQYNPQNPVHQALASLSQQAHDHVAQLALTGGTIKKRKAVLVDDRIKAILDDIDTKIAQIPDLIPTKN